MPTLLKRYTNRRLYDTHLSRYITLEEMAGRIREGEAFQVVDARAGTDLTRKVLMQIIALESLEIAELLPTDFLTTLIRVRDRHLQELFVRSLSLSLEAFGVAQRQLEDNFRLVHHQMALTGRLVRALVPSRRKRGGGSADGGAGGGAAGGAGSGAAGGAGGGEGHRTAEDDGDPEATVMGVGRRERGFPIQDPRLTEEPSPEDRQVYPPLPKPT